MNILLFCPNYGNQFVGMAKELYDHSRVMQEYFEEASTCLNVNFVRLCFASSEQELGQIANAYTSLFLISSSIGALLKEKGIQPFLVSGFGVGGFSAAQIAGSLTLPDGLYFLSKLTQFYQEQLNTLAVKAVKISQLSVDRISSLITNEPSTAIAVINTETEAIVTGTADAIDRVKENAKRLDGDIVNFSVEAGLHSALMDPVIEQLRVYLEKIDFRDTEHGLISSVTGNIIKEGSAIQQNIMNELQSTVRVDLVMHQIYNHADAVIIAGTDTQHQKLFNQLYPDLPIFSVNKLSDIDELLRVLEQNKTVENA